MSFLAVSVLPILSPAPAAGAALTSVTEGTPLAAPSTPLTVALTGITPTVATPKAAITITGTVRNSGAAALMAPQARALLGTRSLTSRQAVADWASASAQRYYLRDVARTSLGATLAPGAVGAFTLTIPASQINHSESFAILPLQVEVVGTTSGGTQKSGDVNTFLPALAAVKAFEPMSIAWLVPLTLDPDPALHGMASPTRTAAWKRAIGPGSRLDRLIRGTDTTNVTWAIDPAILGPGQTPPPVDTSAPQPSPTPSATSAPEPGGAVPIPDPVTALTSALAAQLKEAAPRHTLWSLPYADPDLAALLRLPSGNRLLRALVSRPSTLNVAVGPARADIAWPVGGTLTPQIQTRLRREFASPGLTAAVTSASTLPSRDGAAAEASRKSGSGLPLLAYDDSLSRTAAQTSSKATGAITIQRFLADSMALLGERPGTPNRSVLVAEPRTFDGDPAVLQSLFTAVAKAPWLSPTTTGQILAASQKLAPETSGQGISRLTSPPASPTARPTPDPLSPGRSGLTAEDLAAIPPTLSAIDGVAGILGDGRLFSTTWTDAQIQKLSARWRHDPAALTAIDTATSAAVNAVSRNVRVAPSSVNFFADRGVMQVTVVNNLDVPVHDVHLTLSPTEPRLRIERQPGPLKIGARSRANVRLDVTAIAAGLVSVNAVLTTRNGTPLGRSTNVPVRVQPPASWIYWVLGALAGLVLVLGTSRSLRRGSTRGSRPDAQEPPLHD